MAGIMKPMNQCSGFFAGTSGLALSGVTTLANGPYCMSSHLQIHVLGLEVSRNKFHNAGMLLFTHLRITPTQSPVESCSMVYLAKIETYMHININFKNEYA